ncbi:MAG: hypothetical protein ACI9JK_001298 [Phycisphaerales bacterium]|jgi:hypothetical protein
MRNFITCLSVCVLSSAAFADTWTVDDDGKADFNNIQAAVDAASDGDEIMVMPGKYIENISLVNKSIRVYSSYGPDMTIIDGNNNGTSFAITGRIGDVINIDGLSIINGSGTSTNVTGGQDRVGGGLYIVGGIVTIQNCKIYNNAVIHITPTQGFYRALGGGIFAEDCILSVIETDCSNNICDVFNNQHDYTKTAAFGGGICSWNGDLTISSSQITANVASSDLNGAWTECYATGGGLCLINSTSTITKSEISHNSAVSKAFPGSGGSGSTAGGGGFSALSNSTATIQFSLISNNTIDIQNNQTWYEWGRTRANGGGLCVGTEAAFLLVGIPLEGIPTVLLSSCEVLGNSIIVNTTKGSDVWGAGLASIEGSNVSLIENTNFFENQVIGDGGSYDFGYGGGVYLSGFSTYVTGVQVMGNYSPTSGGGLYIEPDNETFFVDVTVCGNNIDQLTGSYEDMGGNIVSNICETDEDEDWIPDDIDNCYLYNPDQADCNGNDVGDVCDIADGTSSDWDENGIPDDCECLADIALEDGQVNVNDLLSLIAVWDTASSTGDINNDGNVDIADLLLLIGAWGACP